MRAGPGRDGLREGTAAPLIHVAGNVVVDVLLRDVPSGKEAVDGWVGGNVHFLSSPPECVLGGNGGSAAYVLGRLGNRVTLNTCVGPDAFGGMARSWLDGAGVDLMGAPARHTAVNVISLGPEGTRRSAYYTGDRINWALSSEVEGADWFYASGYGQVALEDLRTLTEVFRCLRSRGTHVAFDPGPWFFACAGPEEMAAAWREVDCLVGTEGELCTWRKAEGVGRLIEDLLAIGIPLVAVKRGGEGVAFGGEEGVGALGTDRVAGANSVGAGDVFNAGLIHGLSRGDSLSRAAETGLRLATEAVRKGRGALGAFE